MFPRYVQLSLLALVLLQSVLAQKPECFDKVKIEEKLTEVKGDVDNCKSEAGPQEAPEYVPNLQECFKSKIKAKHGEFDYDKYMEKFMVYVLPEQQETLKAGIDKCWADANQNKEEFFNNRKCVLGFILTTCAVDPQRLMDFKASFMG